MRESFVWTGENPQVLEPDELVGRDYQDADGRRGKIVANTMLSVTVEFPDPILPVRVIEKGGEHVGAAIRAVNWDLVLAVGFAAVFGIAMGLMLLSRGVPRP